MPKSHPQRNAAESLNHLFRQVFTSRQVHFAKILEMAVGEARQLYLPALAAASSASAAAIGTLLRISRPRAASPIVPVTMTRSPGFAPLRRTILPAGTRPNAAIEIVSGPGVETVSPPSSGQPNGPASEPSPRANSVSHASSTARSAIVSTKPAGVAPFAARSERFTRSALRATVSGG